jgi:hypothetical protein
MKALIYEHIERVSWNDPPKWSGRRETLPPPVKSRGAQTPRDTHAMKVAEVSREHARCGYTHNSYGWQKSVGRIARLVRREVARPRGEAGR